MRKRNFKIKKAISCALVAAMAAGLVACSQQAEKGTEGGKTTEATSGTGETASADKRTTAAEPGEITIWFMNEGENYQKVFNKFEELTKDTLNTHVNLNWTTDHRQEMPLKLMNQEACDLTFDAYWNDMAKNIQDGLYADISKYFNNPAYPGLQKAFSGDILESMYDEEGHIYSIPLFEKYNDTRSILIRGDWRKKYNLPEVTDEETFHTYLSTMAEHKDELGIESPIGLGNRGYFYFKYDNYSKLKNNICEVDSTGARVTQQFEALISDDGKTVLDVNVLGDPDEQFADYPEGYQYNYRTEAAIELGNSWGQFVNEDFTTASDTAARFYNGKFAAVEGLDYVTALQSIQSVDPEAEIECYYYESQVMNMEPTYSNQSYSNNYMVIPYYSENIERTMKFLDWIFSSQENNDLFHYGIEGEDYKLNADGTTNTLTPANKYNFPGYELCWNPMYYHTNSLLGDYVKYDTYSRDKNNFKANPILGFVFNTKATNELSTSLAAYKATQENYYHHFMAGKFGADTEAKIKEFYDLASPDIEVIRAELMSQLQAFLDKKN